MRTDKQILHGSDLMTEIDGPVFAAKFFPHSGM